MTRERGRWILCATVATLVASGSVREGIAQRLALRELSYGRLPLSFELNIGQTGLPVKFLFRTRDSTGFLTASSIVLAFKGHRVTTGETDSTLLRAVAATRTQTGTVLRINFVEANPSPEVTGINQLPGNRHYLIGNDRDSWHTHIPSFASVQYRAIYPGIDLVFYGEGQQLEYDFVIAPGADPDAIKLRFEGAPVRLDSAGDLVVETPDGELRQRQPFVFQLVDGRHKAVACRYVLKSPDTVGLQAETYDPTRPLIIDPLLSYSTYLGGGAGDRGNAIAVDSAGNAYITGETLSIDFPSSPGALQMVTGGSSDVFVTKLDSTGTAIVYSTYLGGTSNDRGSSIGVDSTGSAYVTGRVASVDFPATPGSFRTFFSGGNYDAFITKLSPDGSSLIYSTYLGGTENDAGYGIAVDASGSAYVTGGTSSQGDFPVTGAVFQPTYGGGVPGNDAFVTKITPSGDNLEYSSYLGGSFVDRASSIAIDSAGSAYVTGWTESPDFPVFNPWQPSLAGVRDAYVTKVSPDGTTLLFSSFLGGLSVDAGLGIAVDASGSAYVTGYTESEDFPTINAFQPARGGGRDAFVTRFDSAMSAPVYSTYFGGSGDENVGGIAEAVGAVAIDATGSAYVSGATRSADFPTLNPTQPNFGGGVDVFVTKLDDTGSPLYSTYLGGDASDAGIGIAVDLFGAAYVTGQTLSGDFPVVNSPQPTIGGGADAFVAKLAEPVGARADLAATKTGRPERVIPGSVLRYFITTTNSGPDRAADVMLADELPPNTTFLGMASPADWSCTTPEVGVTGSIACTTTSLASGITEAFTVAVQVNETVPEGTVITNSTSARSSTSDPDLTNNAAATATTVTFSAAADASVAVTASPEPVSPGSNITYRITVTNSGPDALGTVWIFDELPLNTKFQTAAPLADWSCITPEVGSTGSVTCTTSLLAPGAAETFTLDVQVDAATENGTLITNSVWAGSFTSDPDWTNNSASVTTTVMASITTMTADLSTFMAGPEAVIPESVVSYWIAATNNGPDAAASVSVAGDIPPHTTFQSLGAPEGWSCTTPEVGGIGTVGCASSFLDPWATAWILLEVLVDENTEDGTFITNTVRADSPTIDPDRTNNSATVTTIVWTCESWQSVVRPCRSLQSGQREALQARNIV
jgi:uncharacterized repeat protein (TIGR01451 family)